ncbi:MAG TPA: four helix bundle suffix domain-containing protein [Verrucomicrobiae bacterium]|nr:four helix bundle suffix domain-containing protein [Verrucomicrobiae bacterium]
MSADPEASIATRARLRPSGGYRKLRSYQVATIIYDGTVSFCDKAYASWLEHPDPAVVANALICLIHQANYLLDQQITALERDFVKHGGYGEQLAAVRVAEQNTASGPTAKSGPASPQCGKPLVLRTARKGAQAGRQFWGCSAFPQCKGARTIEGSVRSVRSDRSQPR